VIGVVALSLSGCDPDYVSSRNGLTGPSERVEPFDSKLLGEWYDPGWEKVEWMVERLVGSDGYFITHFGEKREKSFFTGTTLKVGNLRLLDLKEPPAKGRPPGPHLLMKIDYQRQAGFYIGTFPGMAKKLAALGGGPLYRCKTLTLRTPRKQYFIEHPGLLDTDNALDENGNPSRLMLVAEPNELRDFFSAHGEDKGLWTEEAGTLRLESKVNPGD
jgi:hypothetical protein